MNQTPSQHLPYPDENDPGNGALQLQVLAEAIDAKLVDQFAEFRAVVNRPAFIIGITSTQSYASGSTNTITWDAFTYNSAVTTSPGSSISFYETGYWMIGAYIHTIPAGATTANAFQYTTLNYTGDLLLPLGDTVTNAFWGTNFQSGTGGEYTTITGLVRQEFDGTDGFGGGGDIELTMNHANAASNLVVQTDTIMWAFKVCDLEDL